MIVPAKYQSSSNNDPDNSSRINNITKKYNSCLKKFALSNKTNSQESKENQAPTFKFQVLEWFFKLSYIDRIKVSTINNKWVFQTLHQLYTEQKKKENLKFIPRINEKSKFLKTLAGKNIFNNNPSHFINYFALSSQDHQLIKDYNEQLEKEFLKEIIFIYPDIAKNSKIKMNEKETINNLSKYYYPYFTLSDSLINNRDKFIKYFKALSSNEYFFLPPEVKPINKQNENNDKNDENNKLIDSFNFNKSNSLSKIMGDFTENNSNNNSYNNKIQNFIDLPKWAKQPPNSNICFSVNEILLAFIEQNIVVHYILFFYDNQFYNSLLNDYVNKIIEEFISLKSELKDFLSINKENLLDLLNINEVTKDIYYNPNIEKFVSIKKYQDNLISKTKCWKENIKFEEENEQIRDFFCNYNNDNESMLQLINDLSTLNIEQIYSFEDFFFNKLFFNLNKKYEDRNNENLISEFYDIKNNKNNEQTSKNKKKKNRKKKKKKDIEEKKEENNNENEIKINNENQEDNKDNKENKNIEIKKYISIEEDEELSRIKKGYAKLETNETNLCESSGSENNCDSKPLIISNGDIKQIMKEKENKYNSNNEDDDTEENKIEEKIDKNEIQEDNKNEIINEEENKNEIINGLENKENIIIQNSIDKETNKNNSDIKLSNNIKKKKNENFFLFPTNIKKQTDKKNKSPFIMKLNDDIIYYNNTLLMILDSLSPLKEFIIDRIKSQINECLYNDSFSYKIDIYGSFKSHLDIVCSDIDMVFIPKKINNVNISDVIQRLSNHLLSTKEYFKVTPIYTASIPLIKLLINYENYLADNKPLLNNYSKLINSDLYKNYPYDREKELSFINIDISFPVTHNNKKSKNTPFLQIEYIKNSLLKYTDANIVIRILKRALKLTDMNNSYKGGLSSYTLFLLVISFLKNTNKTNGINNNNKPKKNSYGHAFHDSVKYFSKFDFYKNIIDVENKNGEIFTKRNKRYSSLEYENIPVIIDPVTGQNAGKSSFRINDVQKTIIIINEELEKLRNIYDNSIENSDNKENANNNDNISKNLIITLLKNVEKRIINK